MWLHQDNFRLEGRRVWVAGHRGMVGSALMRRLECERCDLLVVDRADLDLTRQSHVLEWMEANRPEVVFLAAAKVGGILANATRPAEFLYENIAIASHVVHAAWKTGVLKLLFLGSSCIYPKAASQPIVEEALLSGPLEETNEWYAVAKIAGVKLCQAYRRQYGCDFVSAMPTNLYGFGDRYDLQQGHVVAALIMKIHAAKAENKTTVELWGTGTPVREFLYVDDLADACVFIMKNYSGEAILNVGSGIETSIRELAEAVAAVVGWTGTFVFDAGKPDGTPRKVMNVSRLAAQGWTAKTSLTEGLARACQWYADHVAGGAET